VISTLFPRVLLAILGMLAVDGFPQRAFAGDTEHRDGPALERRQEAPVSAASTPLDSFVSVTNAPLRPCLTPSAGTTPDFAPEASLRPHSGSEEARRAARVEGLILTKYLHFRESLSAP